MKSSESKRGGKRTGAGKPPYHPTEADRTTVMVMTAAGIPQERIAACLGTEGLSDRTMRKYFRRELDIGVDKVNGIAASSLVRAVQNGEAWAVCFWMKSRMRWRTEDRVGIGIVPGGGSEAFTLDTLRAAIDLARAEG